MNPRLKMTCFIFLGKTLFLIFANKPFLFRILGFDEPVHVGLFVRDADRNPEEERAWWYLAFGVSALTQSWRVKGDEPDLWGSSQKSADGGQTRQLALSEPLRGPRRSLSLSATDCLRRERGAGDGGGAPTPRAPTIRAPTLHKTKHTQQKTHNNTTRRIKIHTQGFVGSAREEGRQLTALKKSSFLSGDEWLDVNRCARVINH